MRTLKKLAAALFITILTASSAFAIVYGQAGYETEGYDEASAWEINSVSVLKSVRDDFNSGRIDTLLTRYFRLTKDLDITSETSWTPIGTESRPFNGVFDGNSHTVKVLMSTSGLKYTGFFGYVEGGVIQNLNIKGKVIGSVNNNYSSYSYPSNADAYNYAGGIAAYVDNGRIENCKFDGQVKSTTSAYTYWYSGSAYSYAYAGGIVAKNEGNIIINNCSVGRDDATTTITAASTSSGNGNKGSKSYASGIIGYLNDTDYNNKITSNYARVTATADEARNRIYGYRNAARGTIKDNQDVDPDEPDEPDDPTPSIIPPAITTSSLPSGEVDSSYSATITANGTTPFTWTISNDDLPPGLTLSDGTISGTPTKEGTYSFTVTASNTGGSSSRAFRIKITDSRVAPTITTSSYLGSYVENDSVNIQLSAEGTEPITWSNNGGTMPTGLTLSSSGVLSGTLSAGGNFSFTVSAANARGSDSRSFTMDVKSPRVEIDTDSPLGNATVGEYYSEWFDATGYDLPSYEDWKWSATDIPDGFNMDSDGYFYGTPTKDGTFTFTVKAANGSYSATKTFKLTVDPAKVDPPSITTSSLPQATLNESYSYQLGAESEEDVTWSVYGLPRGLSCTSDGLISGIPMEDGYWSLSVYAGNDGGTDVEVLSLYVYAPPTGIQINSENFPDDNFRDYISENIDADENGWLSDSEAASVTEISVRGLEIEDLTGIEFFKELTSLTVWDNKLTEIDLSENTKLNYLDVDNNQLEELDISELTALESLFCENNKLEELDVSNNTGLKTLFCSGNKMPALNLVNNTSLTRVKISDQNIEPLSVSKNASGRYMVELSDILDDEQLERVNSANVKSDAETAAGFDAESGVATFYSLPKAYVSYQYHTGLVYADTQEPLYMTVCLYPSDEPSIVTQSLPDATQEVSYSAQLEALCKTPVVWEIDEDDELPEGLELDEETGEIYGVPEASGMYSFTIHAYDEGYNYSSVQTLTLKVNEPAVTVIAPTITTTSIPDGTVGISYYASIEATGTEPYDWSMSVMPDGSGLSLRGMMGHAQLTGPGNRIKAGTYTVTVTLSNSAGSDTATYSLTINEPQVAPTITTRTRTLTEGHINEPYSETFKAEGSDVTWEYEGTLPEGLSFSGGVLSGTPTEEGTFEFAVTAVNDYGEDTCEYELTINGDAPEITTTSPITSGHTYSPYTFTFEATGSGTITWSYSGTLPDGLTLDSDGTLSGTPTVQGRYSFAVIATNNTSSARKTFRLVIEASTAIAPTIITANLPAATVDVPYSAELSADGTAPITWTVSGDIPDGLEFSEDGSISGTPSVVGRFTLKITASNVAGPSKAATRDFVLIINGVAPTIKTAELPEASAGVEYSFVLSADGTAPISWDVTGNLPEGLAFDASEGKIYGTPSEAGQFNISLMASNIAGSASKTLTLNVKASLPSIKTASLPSATINTAYEALLEADGTSPITWGSVGNLPRGLELDTTGAIRGTPTISGSFDIRLTAKNSAGVDSKDFRLFIDGTPPTVKINGSQSGYAGTDYSAVIELTGTKPIELSVSDGQLPAGLTLNKDSLTISGTLERKGVYTFELTATNVAGEAKKSFTITVNEAAAPTITTAAKLPDAYEGEHYEVTLAAEGGDELEWSIVEGELPDGLELNSVTGEIEGQVNASSRTFNFKVRATNDFGYKEKSFSIKVNGDMPGFKTDSKLKTGKWHKRYSQTIKLENFKATTWMIDDDLPEGLSFKNGKISGKPEECGHFEFNVTASNGGTEINQDFELTIEGVEPKLRGSFKRGTEGEPYTSTLKAKGSFNSESPIEWDFEGLPQGLTFEASATGETCTISGIPEEAFSDKVTVTLTNGAGDETEISKKLKMNIKAIKPEFETQASELATWKLGEDINFQFKLSKAPSEVLWTYSGKIPDGLEFDKDDGTLQGTPTKAGKFKFKVTAKNANKTSYKKSLSVTMTIVADETPDINSNGEDIKEDEATVFENGIAYHERGELTTEMLARVANADEVIAAVLPAIEVEESGMYEFTVSLDESVPEGKRLVWHSFPDGKDDENDADNAIFLDDEGNTVEVVPEAYSVTVGAWLEPGVIYEPVIAVKIRD